MEEDIVRDAGRAIREELDRQMRLAQSEAIDKMHKERRLTMKRLKLTIHPPGEKE